MTQTIQSKFDLTQHLYDKWGPTAVDPYVADKSAWTPEADFSSLPSHVYRVMDENDFQDSMKRGYHHSDERGNYLGQAEQDPELWGNENPPAEGTVAGRWAYPGYLTNAPSGLGRIVKIRVHPEDKWENHPEDEEGGYVRTFNPIPVHRFEDWTEPINANLFQPAPRIGKTANILDPIHTELDPDVFENAAAPKPKLKPQHRHWIESTVKRVLTENGYTHVDNWLRLVLTGSLTTYQYSEDSDTDVSLFVNTEKFPEWSRAEMIGLMVDNIDGTTLPGTTHPMQCFVVPPGIQPRDLYQPGLRSGYDLKTDEWFVPPEHNRVHDVQAEQNGYYVYALEAADKMERLLRYEPDKAVQFWHQIHKRRQRDQKAGKGDFSESNIVYKFLANRGLFPAISEASGEYIAKESRKNQVAKFVYDVPNNRLVLGEMGREEGEKPNHFRLMEFAGIEPRNAAFGQVWDDGLGETFGRPKISIGLPNTPDNRPMNQYGIQYRTEEALRRALPGVKFHNEQELLNPRWELEDDPEIHFHGEPPVIIPAETTPQPWQFG